MSRRPVALVGDARRRLDFASLVCTRSRVSFANEAPPVTFPSQQHSPGRQASGGRGVVPSTCGLSRRRATALGLRLVRLHTLRVSNRE